MNWTDHERRMVSDKFRDLWDGFDREGRLSFYLEEVSRFQPFIVLRALKDLAGSQEFSRRPSVKAIEQRCRELTPKTGGRVEDNAPRYTWEQFKERVKTGQVYIPDEKMAAFNWLDGLLKGRLTGMGAS